jgi:hypothetical protein
MWSVLIPGGTLTPCTADRLISTARVSKNSMVRTTFDRRRQVVSVVLPSVVTMLVDKKGNFIVLSTTNCDPARTLSRATKCTPSSCLILGQDHAVVPAACLPIVLFSASSTENKGSTQSHHHDNQGLLREACRAVIALSYLLIVSPANPSLPT